MDSVMEVCAEGYMSLKMRGRFKMRRLNGENGSEKVQDEMDE